MIPALSWIIAAYVIVRCAEILAIRPDHWGSSTGNVVVKLLAVGCIGLTLLMVTLISLTGSTLSP
jgi:hypothetical protein